jgi:threonine/homoserine/homoserine lactone efflux protein
VFLYIIQGIGYGFAAAVQPGPFQTYIIAQTLNSGWRRTLPAVFAPLVSDGPIIVLVLLVLSQVPDWFQRALYVAGGLFILFLAFNAFRGWRNFDPAGEEGSQSGSQSLFKAAMMNVLSPGPYLFWSLVTGPILLAGWRQAPTILSGHDSLSGRYHCRLRYGQTAGTQGKSHLAGGFSRCPVWLWPLSTVAGLFG